MKILLFAVAYVVIGLVLLSNPFESISSAVVFGLATLGASKLSGVTNWRQFSGWARKNPGAGFMTVGFSLAVGVMGLFSGVEPVRAALTVPLAFAWFWLFSTVVTIFRERRLKREVETELARRAEAKGAGDAL